MGLPIWREPGSASVQDSRKAKADLTTHHAQARSSIRRQNSVRIPNSSRPTLTTRLARSPPPNHVNRSIPPIPRLPRPGDIDDAVLFPSSSVMLDSPGANRARGNPARVATLHDLTDNTADPASLSPIPDPLPSEYRPRSRRGTITYGPTAIDEMPPLRRMNHRSITDSPLPVADRAHARAVAPDTLVDPSAPSGRDGSMSPDGNQWETLLTTITPDPSLPSADSSFTSAAASFPRAPSGAPSRHRPRARYQAYQTVGAPLSPDSSQSPDRRAGDEVCPNEPADALTRERTRRVPRPSSTTDQPNVQYGRTYRQLLEAAHAFHHWYDHLDFYFAEFLSAYGRDERTQNDARDVVQVMSESTAVLSEAYERRRLAGDPSANALAANRPPESADWQRLFEHVLSSTGSMAAVSMSRDGTFSTLSNEDFDERLRAAAMAYEGTDLNELRAMVRERTDRRLGPRPARSGSGTRGDT